LIRRSVLCDVLAACLLAPSLLGQIHVPALEFELASVKSANADLFDVNNHVPSFDIKPGRILSFRNITLKDLIMLAYGAGAAQVKGPDCVFNRFDIAAKIPIDSEKARIPIMLQTLLIQRFKLALHREKKTIPVYALEIGSSGAKLQESAADASGETGCARSYGRSPGPTFAAVCSGVTMAGLAQAIQTLSPNYFDRPVVDATGLKATYDVTLEWISYAESMAGDGGPTIFDAVRRLGLNFETRHKLMDIYVIDHCERQPTEN
jgi:uncharacterized protein (TIGR03435 family)